jgi:hypothetical protein
MPDEHLRRCIEVFGCDFYLLFGQAEMSPTATMFRPEHPLSHASAVGTPVVHPGGLAPTSAATPGPHG